MGFFFLARVLLHLYKRIATHGWKPGIEWCEARGFVVLGLITFTVRDGLLRSGLPAASHHLFQALQLEIRLL